LYSCIAFELRNFQTSILFETNKFQHWGPLTAGDPGQLPPLPPLNPALVVYKNLLLILLKFTSLRALGWRRFEPLAKQESVYLPP